MYNHTILTFVFARPMPLLLMLYFARIRSFNCPKKYSLQKIIVRLFMHVWVDRISDSISFDF